MQHCLPCSAYLQLPPSRHPQHLCLSMAVDTFPQKTKIPSSPEKYLPLRSSRLQRSLDGMNAGGHMMQHAKSGIS